MLPASQATCSRRKPGAWASDPVIEAEQTARVRGGIDGVWSYVQDIARWAEIMPGYRESTLIDADTSHWTLKVGVGGLVRTVKVHVHVDEWAGPGLVRFTYKLAGDPVHGSGTYRATAISPTETDIALAVRVEGSGPMAPMWEAMGRPLLPQFARQFAEQLRDRIEEALGVPEAPAAAPAGLLQRLWAWLRRMLGR